MTATLHTPAAPRNGIRIAAAAYFESARAGRAQKHLPPLIDGDTVLCPSGYPWERTGGLWIAPGHTQGLCLTDAAIAEWWRRSSPSGERVTITHQLTRDETHRIGAPWYATRDATRLVTGTELRAYVGEITAWVSAHLELTSGTVTLRSRTSSHHDVTYTPYR